MSLAPPILILFGIAIFLVLFTYFVPIGLWISAFFAGVRVHIFKDLVGMRLRRCCRPPSCGPESPLRLPPGNGMKITI